MIYLDNGATSYPKPPCMIAAMEECIKNYCGNPGRSGHYMSIRTGEEVYHARRSVSSLFNINKPERLVFTKNTTEAINLGLRGLLKGGEHVVTTSMEHNSVLRPLKSLERLGIEHSVVQGDSMGRITANEIFNNIKNNTKLIIVTAASNVTGTKMPLKEIGEKAKKKEILFMVDGAQGAGSLSLDVEELYIDMLAVPGHKGLLGPLGTGALYVREGINIEHIMEGGTGTASKKRVQPYDFPEGYEAGTINAPAIIGLGCSSEYIKKIGIEVIEQYEKELISWLDAELANMGKVTLYGPSCSEKVGISLFNIKGMGAEEVTEELSKTYGIAVRGGFHCSGLAHKTIGTWNEGAVRVSVGPYNTKKEMRAFVEALHKMSKNV